MKQDKISDQPSGRSNNVQSVNKVSFHIFHYYTVQTLQYFAESLIHLLSWNAIWPLNLSRNFKINTFIFLQKKVFYFLKIKTQHIFQAIIWDFKTISFLIKNIYKRQWMSSLFSIAVEFWTKWTIISYHLYYVLYKCPDR